MGGCLESWSPARLRGTLRIIVVVVLFGLITHGHFAASGDPVHYQMIAHSLAFDRDLDMADDYADPGDVVATGPMAAGSHVRPGRGGILRPVHDVGLPFVASPYYAFAHILADRLTGALPETVRRRAKLSRFIMLRQLMCLGMIALTAWMAGVFFDVGLSLSGSKAAAWLAALVCALSPPVLTHGYVFFTEVPSALLALLAFKVLRGDPNTGPTSIALAGLLAGFLPLVHVRNVGLALGLAVVAARRLWPDRKRVLHFAIPFALMLAARALVTHHLWGTWLTTPHAGLASWPPVETLLREMATRGLGLFFDQEHGLLPSAPVYLLFPLGLLLLRRRSPKDAADLMLLGAFYFLPVLVPMVNAHGWRGGWSPAARFLVPIVPLLALPFVTVFGEGRLRALVIPLVTVQLFLDAFFWARPMLTWAEASGMAPFLTALGGPAASALFPSWLRSAPEAFALAGAALLGWAFLTAWGARRTRAHPGGAA